MKKRQAFTLIELVVSMTAGTSLLILAIGMLNQSMDLAKIERGRADQQRRSERLAREFRTSIHQAADCSVVSSQRVEITSPGNVTITYEANGARVVRRQVSAGEPAQHDSYQLDDESRVTFEAIDDPSRVVMTVAFHSPVSDHVRVDRQVSVVVGRRIALQSAEVSP